MAQPGDALTPRGERRRALALWLMAGLAGAVAFALLRAMPPPPAGAVAFCPLRRFLGLPCPGCGMTRALAHLARGEWREALTFHPLAPLVAGELALAWAAAGLALTWRAAARLAGWVPAVLAADAALFIALWAGRLASGTWPR
jgi:hypothetical protein